VSGPIDPARHRKAIKILEQFERLAQKLGIHIPAKRLERLRELRDAGTIRSGDLPAGLTREFPGEFAGQSLETIRQAGGQ
jgi:hypothetical protein